ncbi:MAG: GH12 family glycosyl hydrolase domain-containing protein [Flavobacteriaceae bacterium]
MKKHLLTSLFLLLFSCAKKEDPSPEINTSTELERIFTQLPAREAILFDEASTEQCDHFGLINHGEFNIENNTWNATNLTEDSYQQCIYRYSNGAETILGWKWSYPTFATGINAYPQLIYGKKPWHESTTTTALPREISTIDRLKAHYDVSIYRNTGEYNLAFDNWIASAASSRPEDLLFEFMIWEDYHDISPFGEFISTVTTPNGTYDLFMGEPTWEPEGTNWTYIAFVRNNPQTNGTVDIDFMLDYLVEQSIIPQDSYLSSIEFGTEIGNSAGYAIINSFGIELE